MARLTGPKCRQCRREGEKLFLKGEKCFTSKCPVVRRAFPPGAHGPTQGARKPKMSGFGKQLREKQKAKRIYGIFERQFRNYVIKASEKTGDTGEILKQMLEMRLDNVIYRLGLAKSRAQARQLVAHGHFTVNGKKVTIPSIQVRLDDTIVVHVSDKDGKYFENLKPSLEKITPPSWLSLDTNNLSARVVSRPQGMELGDAFSAKPIVEYYSR